MKFVELLECRVTNLFHNFSDSFTYSVGLNWLRTLTNPFGSMLATANINPSIPWRFRKLWCLFLVRRREGNSNRTLQRWIQIRRRSTRLPCYWRRWWSTMPSLPSYWIDGCKHFALWNSSFWYKYLLLGRRSNRHSLLDIQTLLRRRPRWRHRPYLWRWSSLR